MSRFFHGIEAMSLYLEFPYLSNLYAIFSFGSLIHSVSSTLWKVSGIVGKNASASIFLWLINFAKIFPNLHISKSNMLIY